MTMNDPKRCFLLSSPKNTRSENDKRPLYPTGPDQDSIVTFFQQSDQVCVLSGYTNGKIVWSSALPGSVRSVAISDNGQTLAACLADRCYVSPTNHAFNLDFFPLPQATVPTQASCVRFSPSSQNILAFSTARDIRLVDVTRALAKPDSMKSLFTISGAAAQAVPVSFSFLDSNLILTGWELSTSPYLRLVDLREGSSKSVKIWKSKCVRDLQLSPLEAHLVASHGGNQVAVWDVRGGEAISTTESVNVSAVAWSESKRSTLGLLCESGLFVRRLDLNRSYRVDTGGAVAGAFKFTANNDVAIVDSSNGSLKICPTKTHPIPLCRNGKFFSVSSTGHAHDDSVGNSALFAEVQSVAARMTDDTSLVESVASEEIDFVLPEHVHLETVSEPLSALFDADEILKSSPGGLGMAIQQSPARSAALDLVLSAQDRTRILPVLQGDWPSLVRALSDEPRDFPLLQSVSSLLLSGQTLSVHTKLRSDDRSLADAVEFANALIGEPEHARLDKVREFVSKRTDVGVFLRTAVAVSYIPLREELSKWLALLASERTGSLRSLVLTGFGDQTVVANTVGAYLQNGGSVLNVALLGLLLAGPRIKTSLPPIFAKAAVFVRDEICNRLGGDCWRLRAVIDSLLSEAGPGSARLVCYYCNKTVTGGAGSRCPQRGCHKPLPSCCVCLEPLRLGGDDWNVWCATCRHGGHSRHVRDWFAAFDECPVAGCACQCAAIDGA